MEVSKLDGLFGQLLHARIDVVVEVLGLLGIELLLALELLECVVELAELLLALSAVDALVAYVLSDRVEQLLVLVLLGAHPRGLELGGVQTDILLDLRQSQAALCQNLLILLTRATYKSVSGPFCVVWGRLRTLLCFLIRSCMFKCPSAASCRVK